MRSTGMYRKVDELGRIVLPSEIRQMFDLKTKDALEIFTDDDKIILRKVRVGCIFCDSTENITYFNNKKICADCLQKIKAQP